MSHDNYLSLPLTVELSESSGQLLLGLSCCVVRWLESHEGLSGLDVQDGTLAYHLALQLGCLEQLDVVGHLSRYLCSFSTWLAGASSQHGGLEHSDFRHGSWLLPEQAFQEHKTGYQVFMTQLLKSYSITFAVFNWLPRGNSESHGRGPHKGMNVWACDSLGEGCWKLATMWLQVGSFLISYVLNELPPVTPCASFMTPCASATLSLTSWK